jgi:hypothetical protein
MIILALAVPTPTEAQWRVFNVVLSLVAAAIAAVLPGVLQLRFTPWLRAGGALAVFALVYLVKPTTLVSKDPFKPLAPPPAIELAKATVDDWLRLMDSGEYVEAYGRTHHAWQKRYAKGDFVRLSTAYRSPLGKVVSRSDFGQRTGESPFGDRGHSRAYSFLTQFENVAVPIAETVYVFAEEGGDTWAGAGYEFDIQKAMTSMKSSLPPAVSAEAPLN